jgi:hypothetical protein
MISNPYSVDLATTVPTSVRGIHIYPTLQTPGAAVPVPQKTKQERELKEAREKIVHYGIVLEHFKLQLKEQKDITKNLEAENAAQRKQLNGTLEYCQKLENQIESHYIPQNRV